MAGATLRCSIASTKATGTDLLLTSTDLPSTGTIEAIVGTDQLAAGPEQTTVGICRLSSLSFPFEQYIQLPVEFQIKSLPINMSQKASSKTNLEFFSSRQAERGLKNETRNLKKIQHPNIIELLGILPGKKRFSLITEYIRYGCCASFLKLLKKNRIEELFRWPLKFRISLQVQQLTL